MAVEEKETIGHIDRLGQFLSTKSKEELDEILAYGEKIKAEGERKRKEFWDKYCNENCRHKFYREDFLKLLKYKRKYIGAINRKYKYLDKLDGLEREKFIEEYLIDDMLYSGKIEETKERKVYKYEDLAKRRIVMKEGETLDLERKSLGNQEIKNILENMELSDWTCFELGGNGIWDYYVEDIVKIIGQKEGISLSLTSSDMGLKGVIAIVKNIKLLEGVYLDLSWNKIGAEGVKVIVQNMKLKRGVALCLGHNGIGDEGAKIVAENMNFEEGVILNLYYNEIGDEGAMAISKMKLKEGVELYLNNNEIGDKGAETIMKNMELKEGVILQLSNNKIGEDMKQKLREWGEFYRGKGIDCKIRV